MTSAGSLTDQETTPTRTTDVALVGLSCSGPSCACGASAGPSIIDETYTALAVRLPIGSMLEHLDRTDPHPPLSYLLFKPVAVRTTDLGGLRATSAVASVLAVVVMALWLRDRGVTGVGAVLLFAIAPYQLVYGREMRMYGLLALGGVVAAAAAEAMVCWPALGVGGARRRSGGGGGAEPRHRIGPPRRSDGRSRPPTRSPGTRWSSAWPWPAPGSCSPSVWMPTC